MGSNTLVISRGENGFIEPINIRQGGVDRALTSFVEDDTTIEFAEAVNGTAVLTLTSTDFDFNTPNIDWTVTDTHLDSLPERQYHVKVFLRNNASSLEEHARFKILIDG